ncbi:Flp pilus assembly protein TadD [Povalibacter uvarum]|uniref:Flp pilus assembly protein TadD n=1 Tax=Povalibacter uvarum TaxID=732238 RepID=A0A841HR71_9GAMM|nr:tetratricopeptide repeat protein [Povalibacter uvarum]MBB6094588.1 Flp pilus assembly protein TadD [Povalibacter uvarum]
MSAPDNHSHALRAAAKLLESGRAHEAAELCRRVATDAPAFADAHQMLGVALRRLGELDAADRAMLRSIELAPDRADFLTNRANLLRALARHAEAEENYRAAIHRDTQFRPARSGLLRLLNDKEDPRAETEAVAMLAVDPSDADLWHELGVALRIRGRLAEAEAAYRRAIEMRPAYAVAWHNLGALLSQQRRPEEALAAFDRARALGAKGAALHYNRARALHDLDRFDECEAELLDAISSAPGHTDSLVMLARVRFARGDAQYARSFEIAIAADPANASLRTAFAAVLRDAGDSDRARVVIEEGLRRDDSDASLRIALAATLQESGDGDAASRMLEQVEQRQRSRISYQHLAISTLLSASRPQEALALARHRRSQAPFDQIAIAHEAVAARVLGDAAYEVLYDYDSFVQVFDLPSPPGWTSIEQFNEQLHDALTDLHRLQAHPLGQSLRNGTQTTRSLLAQSHPVIRAFLDSLPAPIAQYRERLPRRIEAHPLLARNIGTASLVGCWSVRLARGGFHVNHVHPEGWLSSAYYVTVPAESIDTSKRAGWLKFGEPRFAVPGITAERFVQPKSGRLVLFPSYMWHGTTPLEADEVRLSIAFDLITTLDR